MKSLLHNKKATYTIGTLAALAIVLVTAAVIIAVGSEILDSIGKEADAPSKVVKQNISFYNSTHHAITFDNVYGNIIQSDKFEIRNITIDNEMGEIMPATNYTLSITNDSVLIELHGDIIEEGAPLHLNYTYTCYSCQVSYNATQEGLKGTNTMAAWLDTIALIVVAAVVIGIIVSSFASER
ncbi:unnamed protein product [marine sediment metagenome]|uniref:Uncharacterized protein n=1 Tax=marine sediment metagenome TaxID=412755 RepID=X1B5S4_9ZZZZ